MEIKEILEQLQDNKITLEQAEKEIQNRNYEDLGYAKIDHNRKERTGASEVVFCQGKPDEFLTKIYTSIYNENGEVLGTRASKEQYELVKKDIPNVEYDTISRILKIEKQKEKHRKYCYLHGRNSRYSSSRRGGSDGRIFWK